MVVLTLLATAVMNLSIASSTVFASLTNEYEKEQSSFALRELARPQIAELMLGPEEPSQEITKSMYEGDKKGCAERKKGKC